MNQNPNIPATESPLSTAPLSVTTQEFPTELTDVYVLSLGVEDPIDGDLEGTADFARRMSAPLTLSVEGHVTGQITTDLHPYDTHTLYLDLVPTGVEGGTYGDEVTALQVSVDQFGRITRIITRAMTPETLGAINANLLGVAGGVATLGATGQLVMSQVPDVLLGATVYRGVWNAATNTPTLQNGVGNKGDYYKVSVAGTTNIDGHGLWAVGDMIIFNGTTWDAIDGTDSEVVSVNGEVGAVVITKAKVGLSMVDNTSDANKPVSTAQAQAIAQVRTDFAAADATLRTDVLNVAAADASAKANAAQSAAISAAATDATSKASAAQSAAIAASTPASHAGAGGGAHAAATQTAAGFMSASDKVKLDNISAGANAYTLPPATSASLGGVKIDTSWLVVDAGGTLSLKYAGRATYVQAGDALTCGGSVGAYGGLSVRGDKGGWAGVRLEMADGTYAGTFMMHPTQGGGIYKENVGWYGYWDNSGNFTAMGDVGNFSDESIKTDWESLPSNFIELLAAVKHGTYRTKYNTVQAGVSAQSLQVALPQAIREVGGLLTVAYGNAALVSVIALANRTLQLEQQVAELQQKLNLLASKHERDMEYILGQLDKLRRTK